MQTDAFEMALAHNGFRTELRNAPELIRAAADNASRRGVIGGHVDFIASGLHHHHAAEDKLIWPKLRSRAPDRAADVARMQEAHRAVEEGITTVRQLARSWRKTGDSRVAQRLAGAIEELSVRVDEHLADEEANVVPLINEYLAPAEWRRFLALGSAFLWRHPKLGLVLGGYALHSASADERRRFLGNVPLPARVLFNRAGDRTFAAYQAKLYGVDGASVDAGYDAGVEMAMVHRVFRQELRGAPDLIRDVGPADAGRASVVARHVGLMVDLLHHHHEAEDSLVWPKLKARVPDRAVDVARMEDAHRGIAEAVERVHDLLPSWQESADPWLADQLVREVERLFALVDEHLADEECNLVPLINDNITPAEWRKATDRGAAFLWKHPKLGLVVGGFVLDAASPEERRVFLDGLPLPQLTLWRLFGRRLVDSYRARLYGPG